jgi:hypothetical protein
MFAHACRLGAEGIVSQKVDGALLIWPCRVWIRVRNPATIAAQREERDLASTSFRQRPQAVTRRKAEIRSLLVPVMGEASTLLAI